MKKLLLFSTLLTTPAYAEQISYAVQADGLPMTIVGPPYSPNVPHAFDEVYGGIWQLGMWEDAHGFELNAIAGVPSVLNVFISGTGFTDPYTGGAQLQMFVRTLPEGWTVTDSIYYDQRNRAFAGWLLDQETFTAPTPAPGDVSWYALTLNAPYSITNVLHVVSNGTPGELTIDTNIGHMDHSVPGPVIGAGVPGLLATAAGLVALARRRRRVA